MRKLFTLALALVLSASAHASASNISPYVPSPPTVSRYPTLQADDKIVFAGDSVTALGFMSQNGGLGWGTQFQQLTSSIPALTVVDSGVEGDTSATLLARFAKTVLAVNPTVVVIWIGVNDIHFGLYPGPNGQSNTPKNIQAMVSWCLLYPHIREVVLVSPECIGEKRDGQNPFDWALDAFALYLWGVAANDHSGRVFYCPMRQYWAMQESFSNPQDLPSGVLTIDGVHPNSLGNVFIRNVFLKEFGR